MSSEIVLKYCTDPNCTKCHGPFSDEALGQRTPEAIAQDDRQAADEAAFIPGHNIVKARETGVLDLCDVPECPWCAPARDARYHAALVVIANEEGAGRWARAINLVSKIWSKSVHEVMSDAVSL